MFYLGGAIQATEYKHLNEWRMPFGVNEGGQLADVGFTEHVGLGTRFATRVQSLLQAADQDEVAILTSFKNRTIQSAKGFLQVNHSKLI